MRFVILFVFTILATGSVFAQPDVLWDRSGDGNHAQFGYRIWSMGDQNDDGFQDWAVSASGEYGQLPQNEARFLLFHGGNPPETTPYMSFIRDPDIYLRYGGRAFGDINGDGYVDWGFQTTLVANPDSQFYSFYLGGPTSDTISDYSLDARPLNSLVLPFGDFNGDGFDDIYHFNNVPPVRVTRMFFGSAEWDTTADWIRHSDNGYIGLPDAVGDFNGDGYDDFVSGNPNVAGGGIYFGSANPDTVPRQQWNNSAFGGTGSADLNNDGRDDIVTRLTAGARVFFGQDIVPDTPDAVLNFPGCPDGAVQEIQSVGDFNHDRYDDIILISQTCNMGWGKLALYLGSPWVNPNPVFQIEGRGPPLNLVGIFTAEALGDVNGDGLDDFAVGCVNQDNDGRRGRAVIFAGDTTYIVPIGKVGLAVPEELSLSVYPNPFNSTTTLRMDLPIGTHNVKLTVTNVLGQTVEQREIEVLAPRAEFQLSLDNHPSGIYFAELQALNQTQITKLVLLK